MVCYTIDMYFLDDTAIFEETLYIVLDNLRAMLTEKERKALERGLKEYRQGKTRNLDEVMKALKGSHATSLKKRPKPRH